MVTAAGGIFAEGSGLTQQLLEKARSHGTVLVIVTLRVATGATPETLESAKESVLAEVAPTRHRVVRTLPTLPQLVLEASEETLRVLSASPGVARIDESTLRRPLR
jgi:hypothetical protein